MIALILVAPFLLYIVGAVIACIGIRNEPMRELTPEEKEMEENLTVFEQVWVEQEM